MRIQDLVGGLRLSRARFIGFGLLAVGVILALLAYDAQSGIDEIGATNDPLLQDRISQLQSGRDAYLVTSIGIVFMGLFAIALLGERSTSTVVSHSEMISAARIMNETLISLSIRGNACYLPARHGLTKERVLIPSVQGSCAPPAAASDDMVLSPGKDGSTPGMIFEPMGMNLLESVERELNTSIKDVGLDAAEGTLQILKHGFGILKDFHFKERDGKTILRVEYSGLLEACRTVRKEKPDTCRQMECIGCSCLLAAAARASGKIVSIENVDNTTDVVQFTLSIRDW